MSFETLIVDLDGTVLRGDMLYESFWSALGRDWRSPFLSAAALSRGRASLKHYLASAAEVEGIKDPKADFKFIYIYSAHSTTRRFYSNMMQKLSVT